MGAPTPPNGTWYTRFRQHRDQRSFYKACAVSVAFHLSMVTVFNVVIYFPREDMKYYDFTIVSVEVPEATVAETAEAVSTEAAGGGQLTLRGLGGGGSDDSLRDFKLPTLQFAELERLRTRQEGVQALSRFDDVFREPADDSWSLFSKSLSTMSRSLSELRLSGGDSKTDTFDAMANDPATDTRLRLKPAEGFEAFVVWSTEPKDRKLLFAPPVEALWNVDPTELTRPIDVVLKVNALGRVVEAFIPNVGNAELVDAVQSTAFRYRFEPLPLESGASQSATLTIRRAKQESAE